MLVWHYARLFSEEKISSNLVDSLTLYFTFLVYSGWQFDIILNLSLLFWLAAVVSAK